jgi:hypothetical protein
MEVEQYKCYYNGIHPTTEVVGFLPVRIVNEMWEIKHLSISSPVVEFEMDYFGRKEAVAHLADGHKIHLFHNAELHCDVVEIFHGETLLQTTVIPRPETRYKKIRFLAGKIRVLFLRKIPEDEWTNRLIPYEAVIPHDVGKIATVKPYVRNFRK